MRFAEFLWLFDRNQNAYVFSENLFMYFFLCFFLILRQINAKHTLADAIRRLHVITQTDHTCAYANLDLSEMGIIVQVTVSSLKSR